MNISMPCHMSHICHCCGCRAFLSIHQGKGCYCWTPAEGWELIHHTTDNMLVYPWNSTFHYIIYSSLTTEQPIINYTLSWISKQLATFVHSTIISITPIYGEQNSIFTWLPDRAAIRPFIPWKSTKKFFSQFFNNSVWWGKRLPKTFSQHLPPHFSEWKKSSISRPKGWGKQQKLI